MELDTKKMVYAGLFGSLTALGAYIIIPFPLVPITCQTLFLNLSAAFLGGRYAALSQLIYIFLGIMGLPVFAGGKGGLGVLFGPTGGYLLGFILAAFITGSLIEKSKKGIIALVLPMLLGMVVIYMLGVLQLSLVSRLSLKRAILVGVIPFIIGDFFKILIACLIYFKLKDRVRL